MRYRSLFPPMSLRSLTLIPSGPVELPFPLSLIAAKTCPVVMSIRVGCIHFPSDFSVCGVGPVRNSVNELSVEDTCNVSGADVCAVPECHGASVLLWWSPVGHTVYRVPAGACVSSVVPWFFYVFPPDFCTVCAHEGGDLSVQLYTPVYCDLVEYLRLSSLRVLFCCEWAAAGVCLRRESCPLTGASWQSMPANVLPVSCMSVGGCSAVNEFIKIRG